MLTLNKEERIIKIYGIFKRIMKRYGRMVSFPKNTDPRKTYNWRYLNKFSEKFDQLNIDDKYMPRVINAIVQHASSNRLLERGIAILNRNDILELSIAQLEKDVARERESVRIIKQSHDFIMSQLKEGTITDLLKTRINKHAYANLTRWYKTGFISFGYIAVSRSCRKALGTLDQLEIKSFPSPKELLRVRLLHIHNKNVVEQLSEFMGDDLFVE